MDKTEVIGLGKSEYWNRMLEELEVGDVYFTADYHKLFEENETLAKCFIFQTDENLFFYPFLMKPINKIGNMPLKEESRT